MGLPTVTSNTGEFINEYTGHDETDIQYITFNSRYGFSAQNNGDIHRWDKDTLADDNDIFGHTERVYDLAFDGELFSASRDTNVKKWDVDNITELDEFTGHSDRVYSVFLTPDWGYSSGFDEAVRKWDRSDMTEENSLTFNADGNLSVTKIRGDDGYTAGNSGVVYTFNPDDMTEGSDEFDGHQSGETVKDLGFYDGNGFSVCMDGTLRKWDRETLTEATESPIDEGDPIEFITIDEATGLGYFGGEYDNVKKFDADTMEVLISINPAGTRTEATNTDEKFIYTGDNEGNLEKWYK